MENSMVAPHKTKNTVSLRSATNLLGVHPKILETFIWKSICSYIVNCSIGQDMKKKQKKKQTNPVSFDKWLGNNGMLFSHTEHLF